MLFMLEFQKNHSRTLRFSTNRKNPILGANGVVGYVTERQNRPFWLVLPRPRLVRGVDRRRHIALTAEFFGLLLSSRGEECRWSSGKDCREVFTSGRRRVHARPVLVEKSAEFSGVAFQKLSLHLRIKSSVLAQLKWVKTLQVALGQSKVSCSSAFSTSIDVRMYISGRVHHRGYAGLRGPYTHCGQRFRLIFSGIHRNNINSSNYQWE